MPTGPVECHPGGLQTTVGGGPQQRTTAAGIGQTSPRVDAYAPTGSKDGGGTVGNVDTVVVVVLVVGCPWDGKWGCKFGEQDQWVSYFTYSHQWGMNWGEITHLLSIYHLLPSSWDVQVVETPGVGGRVTVGKVVERFEFFFFFFLWGWWCVLGCWLLVWMGL